MAVAVLALMLVALIAPSRLSILPGWVLASIEGLLLLALIVGDPGRIDRTGPWQRRTSIALVVVILGSTLAATSLLIFDLVTGSSITNQADELLLAGAKVWLGNNIAFAFLYWEFDAGGPAARAHSMPRYPDLAFPSNSVPTSRHRAGGHNSSTISTWASRRRTHSARPTRCRWPTGQRWPWGHRP